MHLQAEFGEQLLPPLDVAALGQCPVYLEVVTQQAISKPS